MSRRFRQRLLRLRASQGAAWLRFFFRELMVTRITGMAAELAFWLFLALIPLAAVAGLLAARIAIRSDRVAALLSSLPPEVRRLVDDQLNHVAAWNGGSVGPVAAVVFVWLASGGVQAVFDLLEVQTGVSRPWWKKRVIAIGACLGLSAGTALMGVISAGLDGIVSFLRGAIPRAGFGSEQSFVDAFVRAGMTLVTGVALVAGVFYIGVPGPARNGMPILPGALVAVLLQWLLGRGYVFYLAQVGTGSAYQASLSIIAVTLMALYLFALALLIGAEVNASVAKAKKASQPSSRIPPNAR